MTPRPSCLVRCNVVTARTVTWILPLLSDTTGHLMGGGGFKFFFSFYSRRRKDVTDQLLDYCSAFGVPGVTA